jgi:hypothetical protein
MQNSNVVEMEKWLPPQLTPRDAENQDMVMLLTYLLEEARDGKLEGFTGAFLLAAESEDEAPSVGMVASHRMEQLKYLTIGALEKIKVGLLK